MIRRGWLLLGLLALLMQCLVLYSPGSPDPVVAVPHIDKVVHLAIFALPAFAFARAGLDWRLLAGLAVAQSLASEIVQELVLAHRGADPWDAVFDLLGAAVGLGLARWRLGAVSGPA